MVSKKIKDNQKNKPFLKKRIQKRIKMLRRRRSIKNSTKKQENNVSIFPSNAFDKITSLFKATIYNIKKLENEFNENMNLSFINMVNSYLKDCSCPENKNFYFIKKFNDIIKILSMNKNEFVFWTILIDTYMKANSNNWLLETLFYIGLYSKEKITDNFSIYINEYKQINKNFDLWYENNKNLFDKDSCSLEVFNKKYKKLNYMNSLQKVAYHDYEYKVKYICNPMIEMEHKNNTDIFDKKDINKFNINNNIEKNEDKKINEQNDCIKFSINNILVNANKSTDDDECHNNNTINFNIINFVDKLNDNNNYFINNNIDAGITAKNEIEIISNEERKLSPNPYDDCNVFLDSFNELNPNKNINLDNLLAQGNEELNFQGNCFTEQYHYKSYLNNSDE
jgi:hypothetical protein